MTTLNVPEPVKNIVQNTVEQGKKFVDDKVQELIDKKVPDKFKGLANIGKDLLSNLTKNIGEQINTAITPTNSTPIDTQTKPKTEQINNVVKPEPAKLSGWDKFKNFFAKGLNSAGKFFGLKKDIAHVINPEDYVKNEKTGKNEFSWKKADMNSDAAGIQRYGKRGEFDIGDALDIGSGIYDKAKKLIPLPI